MYSINWTLFTGFTWNRKIFFRVTRVLKSLWSPSIEFHTLSWYCDAECDPMQSVSFLYYRSIEKGTFIVHAKPKGIFLLDTQNNVWLIYFLPDVNECSGDSKPCDDNADCFNTKGSYSCKCKSGFIGNGTTCQGSEYLTIRKAVFLLANVQVILGVEVCLLYLRKMFVQRRRKKDRLQESHVFTRQSISFCLCAKLHFLCFVFGDQFWHVLNHFHVFLVRFLHL